MPSLLERISRAAGVVAGPVLSRDVQPLEGTNMSLWNSIIPAWWTQNGMNQAGQAFWPGNGLLAQRVWITNRCIQMNSQQISSMPIRYAAPNVAPENNGEPAWVSNPDPLNYPNGIGSMMRGLVADYYGWGYALVLVTARYADGYPRNMTRIPAQYCTPQWSDQGWRVYKIGDDWLDPADVIQIDRDTGTYGSAHGSSAIQSYAQLAWGLLAAGNLAMEVNTGGIPKAVLKATDPNKDIKSSAQATALQNQWQEKTQPRNGAPPVLPFGLDFETLSWNPKDMALLETQDFNALALATAFGMPAVLINMTVGGGRGNSALTYQTPAMVGDQWWRYELRNTAKAFEDAFTAQALPSGQWVWLDPADTLPQAGPSPTSEDDPQAAATAADQPAAAPATAQASPAQQRGAPRLASIGGNQ